MKLSDLSIGEQGRITRISGNSSYKQKLLSMRILPGEKFTVVDIAPFGCPIKLSLRNDYSISLRAKEVEDLEVDKVYA